MKRETQNLVLLLIGGAVLKISITGAFSLYVKQGLRPYLIVAGSLLLVLGVYGLVIDVLGYRKDAEPPAAEADEHGHHHPGGSSVGWLLLAPIMAIFLVAPPALGAYAAERAAPVATPKPVSASFPALAAGNPASTTLADYSSRAIWDKGATLKGRDVRLVGFVTPRTAGGFYLTRLVISCCAADAFPIKIYVAGDARTPAANTWLQIDGTFAAPVRDEADQYDIATLKAVKVRLIAQPEVPYEQ